MNANLYALIRNSFLAPPQAPLITADTGKKFSYADLDRETARIARLLESLGLRKGDRVAAQVEKSPEGLFLYLGAIRAGMIFLPLNTAYQQGEMGYYLGDAEPALVVCRPEAESWVRPLAEKSGARAVLTLNENGGGTLPEAWAGQDTDYGIADVKEADAATIIYTSGTTGRSKGATLSHGNLGSNGIALRDTWRFTGADVLIHALPMFHVHGLFVAMHCVLLSGARMLFYRKFDAKTVLQQFGDATVLMGVPTFYTRLLAEPGLTPEACRHMRLFVSGSAPLLAETHEEFKARTGHAILERYGMSESGMITSNPYDGERRPGTVGFPLPGISVRIADDQDRELQVGEVGGIQIKGPNVFLGYWRMPEKTAEEFTADGWFRTGDVGVIGTDGYISIVGRAKDLVISGGYNVYPKEIELVIDQMPGVVESAVVGVPHPDFGEAVTAVIVRAPGSAAPSESEVVAHVKSQLAGYKVPKKVHFVDALPRNAMGKVQKKELREKYS